MKRSREQLSEKPIFQRSFAHVDGNWPAFVYIPVNQRSAIKTKNLCLDHFITSTETDLEALFLEKVMHISLSKPFVLRHHHIEPFVEELSLSLRHLIQFHICISSEYFLLNNDEGTRSFLCMSADDNGHFLKQTIAAVDVALEKFRQPCYYADPIYHVSVASMLPSDEYDKKYYYQRETSDSASLIKSSSKDEDQKASEVLTECIFAPRNHSIRLKCFRSITKEDRPISVEGKSSSEMDPHSGEESNGDDSDDDRASDDPMLSVLQVKFIECKIGKRTFRFDLPNKRSDVSKSGFVEKFS